MQIIKKLFIAIIFNCIILLGNQSAFAKKVKFAVDFGNDSASVTGVHVAGDFQIYTGLSSNWLYDSTQLFNVTGTNIYTVVVDIPAFQKYEFGYVNGHLDYETEVVPFESQVQFNNLANRFIYVDSLDDDTLELPAVRFGHNAPANKKMIRFMVDMKYQTVSANGVHLMADFQNQNPSTTRMCPLGDVYHHIAYFDSAIATTVNYDYVNGNTLADKETKDISCTSPNTQRTHTFSADTQLDTVCYSKCIKCTTPIGINALNISSINIAPNPSTNYLQITNATTNYALNVYNAQGKLLFNQNNITSSNFQVPVKFSKGIYLVQFINPEGLRKNLMYVQQ